MININLKNKIIIIAILILSFIGIAYGNVYAATSNISPYFYPRGYTNSDGNGYRLEEKYRVTIADLKLGDEIDVSQGALTVNRNIFCVQHGIELSSELKKYKVLEKYTITPDGIEKESIDSTKNQTVSKTENSDLISFAQGIAYILQLNNTWGNENSQHPSQASTAQRVLWKYLDYEEIPSEYFQYIGMEKSSNNAIDFTLTTSEKTQYNTALKIWGHYTGADYHFDPANSEYSATYYTFGSENDTNQRLIILESTAEPEIVEDTDIEITINKKDYDDGSALEAGFKVVFKQKDNIIKETFITTTGGSASTGKIEISDTSQELEVTITEENVPDGYIGLFKPYVLKYKHKNHKWTLVEKTMDMDKYVTVSGVSDITLDIKNEVDREFSLVLNKFSSIENADSDVMDGTKFKFDFNLIKEFQIKGKYLPGYTLVPGYRDNDYIVEITLAGKWILKTMEGEKIKELDDNTLVVDGGLISVDKITPRPTFWGTERKSVYIKVSEAKALEGYEIINKTILMAVNLEDKDNIKITEFIYTKDAKEALSDIWSKLIGGDYDIEIQGITRLNNATDETKEEINKISVKSGTQIYLELTNQKLITIKGMVWEEGQTGLKSSSAPDGRKNTSKGMEGIKVYLCRRKGSWLGDNWEDLVSDIIVAEEETDENGYYEFPNMEYLSNLYVAFQYDGVNYIETVGAGFGTRGNDSDAAEQAIKIKQDGAWYYKYDTTEHRFIKTTFNGEPLEAESKSREDFNKQFNTIDVDGAHPLIADASLLDKIKNGELSLEDLLNIFADDSNTIELNYNYEGNEIARVDTSSNIFKMYATCDVDTIEPKTVEGESQIEVDCGLVKREFDLDLSTNLESVETKINGKTTNYKYSIDDDGNATLYARTPGNEEGLSENKPTYNQKIYESDYNYDIEDYFDNTGEFTVDEETGEKNQLQNDVDEINDETTQELEVYVTYKIQINNQTNKKAYVYSIVDYYSDVFKDVERCYYINSTGNEVEINSDNITTLETSPISGYKAINISFVDPGFEKKDNFYNPKEIYLTLELDKEKIPTNPTVGNIAEITSYGSDEGYIDMNSRPGNAVEGSNIRYEDDTDKAGTLKIEKDVTLERTLEGIVWDDANKNGKFDSDEKTIDGVTVQLIELREVSGITLEYIWQETTTGDDKVSKTTLDGTGVKTYTYTGDINKKGLEDYIYVEGYDKNNEKFHYLFTGYIPGNYIVRYKYGTEEMLSDTDIGRTDNNKYDGNSYKSTYDSTKEKYNAKTLNITVDGHNGSDAFDNEARRLEEMSIFAGETVTSTTSADLKAHWMCADTSKFEVYFEDPTNGLESEGEQVKQIDVSDIERTYNSKEVYVDDDGVLRYKNGNGAVHGTNNEGIVIEYYSTTTGEIDSDNKCAIENIDFGLMKRPETEISLEKHLTALAIDVAGEGKILDAKFNIDKFYTEKDGEWDEYEECIEGMNANLSSIPSDRKERGFWKFETDVNELMNGAELTAEYTYVVSNNTFEKDYLSAQLMNAYEQLSKSEPCQFIYEGASSETTLIPGVVTFKTLLNDIANKTKLLQRETNADGSSIHTNGYYLGDYYYTGEASTDDVIDLKGGTSDRTTKEGKDILEEGKLATVTVRIDKIEELVNKEFYFDESINYSSYGPYNNFTAKSTEVTPAHTTYYEYKENAENRSEIDTTNYSLVQSRESKISLEPGAKNYDRKIVLTKTLNTNNINEMLFDSYNAEILSYSVASGRRSTSSTPGNMNDERYSYTDDNARILQEEGFESDEFWGETIIITAPTGEDGISTTLWIILGATCALIIAGGIFGIKKFVLKH